MGRFEEALRRLARRHVERGWHSGAQLAVYRQNKLVADVRVGTASEPRDRLVWFSATKPLTAVAILILTERGALELDERVASYWPEFGAAGKETVTVRHVLLHQGGFPVFPRGFDWNQIDHWDLVCESTAALPAQWLPGTAIGYHPLTFGFCLGELIRRTDGRMPREFMRDEIFLPLGMDASLGVDPATSIQAVVLPEAMSESTWQDLDGGEQRTSALVSRFRLDSTLRSQLPAANAIGTAEALARFYAMLLGQGSFGGRRIISPETVGEATRVHAETPVDRTSGMPSSFGLGFLVGGPFEPYCRPGVFGHDGQQCTVAFADPSSELAVAYVTNGLQDPLTMQLRTEDLMATLDSLAPYNRSI